MDAADIQYWTKVKKQLRVLFYIFLIPIFISLYYFYWLNKNEDHTLFLPPPEVHQLVISKFNNLEAIKPTTELETELISESIWYLAQMYKLSKLGGNTISKFFLLNVVSIFLVFCSFCRSFTYIIKKKILKEN